MKQVEEEWKERTIQANLNFNKCHYWDALKGYKAALKSAEQLNLHGADCLDLQIPYIQVFIISCNNLSHTYTALGKIQLAESMLRRSIYFLIHVYENERLAQDQFASELKRATVGYSLFTKQFKAFNNTKDQLYKTINQLL